MPGSPFSSRAYAAPAELAPVHDAMRAAVARSVRLGPDECAARCGVPLDPAAAAGGFTVHPGCEPDFVPLTAADLTARIRLLGQLRRARRSRGRR